MSWLLWLGLAVAVVVHITGESVENFAGYFNYALGSRDSDHPVSPLEAKWKDQIGLALALLSLCALAPWHPAAGWIAIGFVLADTIQHITLSVLRHGYTPGVGTVWMYVPCIAIAFYLRAPGQPWIAAGAALLWTNILLAGWRVRK